MGPRRKRKAISLLLDDETESPLSKMLILDSEPKVDLQKTADDKKINSEPIEVCAFNKSLLGIKEASTVLKKACENSETKKVDFPDSLNIMNFAESRASEIATLFENIKKKRPMLCAQQLPNHMRRRTASHHANRVPRRLREKVLRETAKVKKTKKPSRKHRRRPANLLDDLNQRKNSKRFMETHIWFAKRFKMAELWGYKLPLHSTFKGEKAAIRSTLQNVMLQDLSYFCCIQLEGPQDILISKLALITQSSIGKTFASKFSLDGTREGTTLLNHPRLPHKTIGTVSFIWQPFCLHSSNTEETTQFMRKLWIWCHPAMYSEVVEVFEKLFELVKPQDVDDSSDVKEQSKSEDNVEKCSISSNEKLQLSDKKLINRFQKEITYHGDPVTLTLLKDSLIRHRLIGPGSQKVIANVLKSAQVLHEKDMSENAKWWEEFYTDEKMLDFHRQQQLFWNQIQTANSPNDITPSIVLALTVRDPRLHLMPRKTKVFNIKKVTNPGIHSDFMNVSNSSLSFSPIWMKDVRTEVSATKIPESVLNNKRREYVVPGTQLELGREESRIPVLLIHQPGYDGYGTGWDLVAPLGWSMAFWISFIYCGGHAAGLNDLKRVVVEAGQLLFPYNYPDTKSGMDENDCQQKNFLSKHARYPPSKRPNFEKLGIVEPYGVPVGNLVEEWEKEEPIIATSTNEDNTLMEESQRFVVLRTRKEIFKLKTLCSLLSKQARNRSYTNVRDTNDIKLSFEYFKSIMNVPNSIHRKSLVCIKLQSQSKGVPTQFTRLYMLNETDLELLKTNPKYVGPVEPIHKVEKHSKKAKSNKKTAKDESCESTNIIEKSLVSNCSRKLIGFVDVGTFSYLNGYGTGLGHISLVAFLKVLRMCYDAHLKPRVLLRKLNTFQYRIANVQLLDIFC